MGKGGCQGEKKPTSIKCLGIIPCPILCYQIGDSIGEGCVCCYYNPCVCEMYMGEKKICSLPCICKGASRVPQPHRPTACLALPHTLSLEALCSFVHLSAARASLRSNNPTFCVSHDAFEPCLQ